MGGHRLSLSCFCSLLFLLFILSCLRGPGVSTIPVATPAPELEAYGQSLGWAACSPGCKSAFPEEETWALTSGQVSTPGPVGCTWQDGRHSGRCQGRSLWIGAPSSPNGLWALPVGSSTAGRHLRDPQQWLMVQPKVLRVRGRSASAHHLSMVWTVPCVLPVLEALQSLPTPLAQ